MKILILTLFLSSLTYSQITIGKVTPSSASVLLEFGNDGNKGIILPYTDGEPTNAVPGTFIFDSTVNRIKFKLNGNIWMDLSNQNGTSNVIYHNSLAEAPEGNVTLGDDGSNAEGVLVLDDAEKAMVLPIVEHYTDIENPSPGMIVFVNSNKRLAIFNGSKWSFWKSAD